MSKRSGGIGGLFARLTGHTRGNLPRRPAPNPRPAEWDRLAPDTRYDCAPGETAWLGRHIPRHKRQGSGTVTGCATPTAREVKRAAEAKARGKGNQSVQGQVEVTPVSGPPYHITRNVAKLRVRDVGKGRVRTDDEQNIRATIDENRKRRGRAFPIAPGVEYPHREGSTVCDPGHPLWTELEREASDQQALAIIDADKPLTNRQLRAETLKRTKQTEVYKRAEKAAEDCAQAYEVRADKRAASRHSAGPGYETRLLRARMRSQGVDPTSAEYLETLTVSGRAKRLRAAGRVEEARALERAERERKKNAGRRFRAG
jgi:hypothetical protein